MAYGTAPLEMLDLPTLLRAQHWSAFAAESFLQAWRSRRNDLIVVELWPARDGVCEHQVLYAPVYDMQRVRHIIRRGIR